MAQQGTVTAPGLNLRATPGGPIMTVLGQGTVVEILEDDGGFLKVNAGGNVGFVAARFISRPTGEGGFRFEGAAAVAPDGSIFGQRFKLGIFNLGSTSIADFVRGNPTAFPDLSPSRLRVMAVVSANEGKLEAINTYDNAFLTFGCFQWTVGTDDAPGELPAMVNHLKEIDAAVFDRLLGQFGLDVASVDTSPGQPPTGFFSLNGTTIKTAAQKQNQLRTLPIAFRFFRAGHDNTMRQAQVAYAASRIDLSYRDASHKIRNLFIADFVSSELGVALILDEHVNRPGHVPATLAGAVDEFISASGKTNPLTWNTQDEAGLLNIYVQRRNHTNMTDSQSRADRIRQAVSNGLASAARGSFQA